MTDYGLCRIVNAIQLAMWRIQVKIRPGRTNSHLQLAITKVTQDQTVSNDPAQ